MTSLLHGKLAWKASSVGTTLWELLTCPHPSPSALQRSRRCGWFYGTGIPRGPWKMQNAKPRKKCSMTKDMGCGECGDSSRSAMESCAPRAGSRVSPQVADRWGVGTHTSRAQAGRLCTWCPRRAHPFSLWEPGLGQLGQPCDWQVSWPGPWALPAQVSAPCLAAQGAELYPRASLVVVLAFFVWFPRQRYRVRSQLMEALDLCATETLGRVACPLLQTLPTNVLFLVEPHLTFL